MNISNVTKQFVNLGGDGADVSRFRFLIEEACDYVSARCKKPEPTESEQRRLETLGAVYALRLAEICGDESISSFLAGDLRITASSDGKRFEKMWNELAANSSDLIKTDKFLFGRVM